MLDCAKIERAVTTRHEGFRVTASVGARLRDCPPHLESDAECGGLMT